LISPTFYEQLLCSLFPKAQKGSQGINHFALLEYMCVKALHKHVGEIAPSKVDFTNILRAAFMLIDPKSLIKKTLMTIFLHFWDMLT